ncbi:hypothetical protein BV22DRAFT_1133007 [Leucogyrophana mollusca]|uniref:Uncharacterized protein n=1 Tax=Leucogyrophana mollusca TaxID=85980 RepID=A0ACB8B5K5_9AGAM|nr:hypothetical protein BV22DRAFT_1133007 [Leucogyrophana mollusca]
MHDAVGASQHLTLPTEIWNECWSYSDTWDIKNLCLVCRLFRALCQKRLFRSLYFVAPSPEYVTRDNVAEWADSLELSSYRHASLVSDPDASLLPALVQEWSFIGFAREFNPNLPDYPGIARFEEAYTIAIESFFVALPFYRNIRSIDLSYLDVDQRARAIFAMFPALDALKLNECNITSPKGPSLPLRLCDLSHHSSLNGRENTTEPIDLVLPDRLQELLFTHTHNIELVLPWLLNFQSFEYLTNLTLALKPASTRMFRELLEKCPRLQCLFISMHSTLSPEFFSIPLPSSIVPQLRRVFIPCDVARVLVPGRPVDRVEIHGRGSDAPGSSVIAELLKVLRPSVPLRTLRVSIPGVAPDLAILSSIHTKCPDLISLDLELDDLPKNEDEDMGTEGGSSGGVGVGNSFDSVGSSVTVSTHPPDGNRDDDPAMMGTQPAAGDTTQDELPVPHYLYVGSSQELPRLRKGVVMRSSDYPAIAVDEHGCPVRKLGTFAGLVDHLALGHAHLPSLLETLHLSQYSHYPQQGEVRRFTIEEQHSAIARLAILYPHLKKIYLGFHGNAWERVQPELWRVPWS